MRDCCGVFICVSICLLVSSYPTAGQSQVLSDILKTGRVFLVEELRITDELLPENTIFENPMGLAIAKNGEVFVSDYAANHIKVFDPQGKFLRTLGKEGQGPGDLGWPAYIEIVEDRVLVREVKNRRISILNIDGIFVRSVPFAPDSRYGALLRMKAIPDGRLAVLRERGVPAGFRGRLPEDQDLVLELFSEDLETISVIFEKKFRASRWGLNPQTKSHHRVRFPYHPRVYIDVSPTGILAIGYNEKYEIELVDPDKGGILAISHSYEPVRLEERDKKEYFGRFVMAVFVNNVKKILPKPPDYVVELTEFPEFLPPYRGLMFDPEGNLWVQLYTQSRATNVFDVFSPDGEFLNQITVEGAPIPAHFASSGIKNIQGDVLWQIERDEDGFASVAKYRLKGKELE
jgi:hypothetical protein